MSVVIDKVLAGLSYDAATIGNSEVVITNVQDNDVLQYDSGTGSWVNGVVAGSSWSDPVDANVVPDGNGTRNLGAANSGFANLYVNAVNDLNGGQVMDFTTGVVIQSNENDINFNSNATGKVIFGAESFFIYSQLGGAPALRFFKAGAGNYVQLGISNSISTDTSYVLPLADGTAQHALLTDGSGNMSWGFPRLANNTIFYGRNAANDADINILTLDSGNGITLGGDASGQAEWIGIYSADRSSGSPSLIDIIVGASAGTVAGGDLNMYSGDSSGTSGKSGDVILATGANTATTGDSGDMLLSTGNSTNSASGDIALATGSAGTTRGNITMNANKVDMGSVSQGLKLPVIAGDPSSPVNGDIWYNSTSNALKAYVNGATVTITVS